MLTTITTRPLSMLSTITTQLPMLTTTTTQLFSVLTTVTTTQLFSVRSALTTTTTQGEQSGQQTRSGLLHVTLAARSSVAAEREITDTRLDSASLRSVWVWVARHCLSAVPVH